jgi:hypothetical protein
MQLSIQRVNSSLSLFVVSVEDCPPNAKVRTNTRIHTK